jgi:hypothetical protein
MIDKTPYIIIDDHKLAPIRGPSRTIPASADGSQREDRPFGIVDRVTISKAAMEKYRQLQLAGDADSPSSLPISGRLPNPTTALLPASSKRPR